MWQQLEEAWGRGRAVRETGGRSLVGLSPARLLLDLPGFYLPAVFLDNSPY